MLAETVAAAVGVSTGLLLLTVAAEQSNITAVQQWQQRQWFWHQQSRDRHRGIPFTVEAVKTAATVSSASGGGGRVSWVVVGSLNLVFALPTYKHQTQNLSCHLYDKI